MNIVKEQYLVKGVWRLMPPICASLPYILLEFINPAKETLWGDEIPVLEHLDSHCREA